LLSAPFFDAASIVGSRRVCGAKLKFIVAGEIALQSPQPDASRAEAAFERALATARTRQEKSLELRAAKGMTRLWRDQGRGGVARELLRPICDWFTEEVIGTRDLQVARALRAELH
jgi:predicted ATPase